MSRLISKLSKMTKPVTLILVILVSNTLVAQKNTVLEKAIESENLTGAV